MLAKFDALLTDAERTQLGDLRRSQPGLCARRVDSAALVLGGRLALLGSDGREADAHVVEIAFPRDFPSSMPTVHECGGRIPRIPSRHIYDDDGSCCVELPVEFFLRGAKQTIDEYVNGPVRSYFIAQSYFEEFGKWPHGDLSHGLKGVAEFCAARLGTPDLLLVARLLLLTARWRQVKHERCPCGSGRKLLKCHGEVAQTLRAWPPAARAELARQLCA